MSQLLAIVFFLSKQEGSIDDFLSGEKNQIENFTEASKDLGLGALGLTDQDGEVGVGSLDSGIVVGDELSIE